MARLLRVLLVEDSVDDELLLTRYLRRIGYELILYRVETGDDLERALGLQFWDVVFCGNTLPAMNALRAIKAVQKCGREIPCIVLSGSLSEEEGASLIAAGAREYVSKQQLDRIAPALAREICQAEEQPAQELHVKSLADAEERWQRWLDGCPEPAWRADCDGRKVSVNAAWEALAKYPLPQQLGEAWWSTVWEEDRDECLECYAQVLANGENRRVQYRMRDASGTNWSVDELVVPAVARLGVSGLLGLCLALKRLQVLPDAASHELSTCSG